MLTKIFDFVKVRRTLRFEKGATLVTTSTTGAQTTIDMTELAALNNVAASDLQKIDGITNGTAAAGKALVADSNIDISGMRHVGMTGTATVGAVAGADAALDVNGLAAAQGGAITITGGTSSTTGNAGGAVAVVGGTGGATGAGGAVSMTSGAGNNNSGATAGTAAGAASLVGAAGGTTATGTGGAGGDVSVTAGAGGAATGAGTGGAGGSIVLTPGTGGTTSGGTAGKDGVIIERGIKLVKQGAQTAKSTSATLTAAEVLTGIITVNQAAGATSAQQLPLATDMDTALPDSAAGDAFDFSVINTSTVDAEDASVTTNTGWTLVGNMDIHAYSAAGSLNSSARFRARKTGTGAWTLYRIA